MTTLPTTTIRRAQSGILGALNREWDHLAHSPTHHSDETPWSATHPCLQDLPTVTDILHALRHSPSGSARADELLRALLDLHTDGSQLAGRALIHTMMPRILKMTFTAEARGLDDPTGAALEAMWIAITRFPAAKTTRIAACLALNALNALQNPQETPLTLEQTHVEAEVEREAFAGRRGTSGDLTPEREVASLLAWATTRGVLSRSDVDLLRVLHRADAPSQNHLAREMGISRAAMWKRASRATSRLREAVARAHSAPGGTPAPAPRPTSAPSSTTSAAEAPSVHLPCSSTPSWPVVPGRDTTIDLFRDRLVFGLYDADGWLAGVNRSTRVRVARP